MSIMDDASLPVRVLLVDDHVVLRDGLAALIAATPDLRVVGAVSTAAEALPLAAGCAPDVVVLDIKLPDGNGLHVARALRGRYPALRLLILTAYGEPQYVRAAQRAGATGFLLKEAAGAEMLEALRVVARGGSYIDPRAALLPPAGRAPRPAPPTLLGPLSRREVEVLHLLATGARNEAIGRQLGIAERTIEVHVAAIMDKLGVGSRTEAVAAAAQLGLVSL